LIFVVIVMALVTYLIGHALVHNQEQIAREPVTTDTIVGFRQTMYWALFFGYVVFGGFMLYFNWRLYSPILIFSLIYIIFAWGDRPCPAIVRFFVGDC
jgi:hypothetical protein